MVESMHLVAFTSVIPQNNVELTLDTKEDLAE